MRCSGCPTIFLSYKNGRNPCRNVICRQRNFRQNPKKHSRQWLSLKLSENDCVFYLQPYCSYKYLFSIHTVSTRLLRPQVYFAFLFFSTNRNHLKNHLLIFIYVCTNCFGSNFNSFDFLNLYFDIFF